MTSERRRKFERLQSILKEMETVVIGFSGGIDSTVLLKVATALLGENALAVIGRSETYPTREFEEAVQLASSFGSRTEVVTTEETDDLKFRENPPNRCYFCKTELFSKLRSMADTYGMQWIADGTIVDDLRDFRPGLLAKGEAKVRSPLLEAGLSKEDVRAIAREQGIESWDKPSFACLASRFPYGFGITKENLMKIDQAETVLRDLGFRQFRVRHHDDRTARLELGTDDFRKALEPAVRETIVEGLLAIGFTYITLDLRGYRTGSMNEVLPPGDRKTA
jgi:uncharacterized protein